MFPVPFLQVIDFLNWVEKEYPGRDAREISFDFLHELAMAYLQSTGGGVTLETILKIFQTCPMISEANIRGQLRHFVGCGLCPDYLRREGLDPLKSQLHPLFRAFLRSEEGRKLEGTVERIARRIERETHEERAFQYVIRQIGPLMVEAFESYLRSKDRDTLIKDYEEYRRQSTREAGREREFHEEPTQPIAADEDIQVAATRLAESVRLLVESDFYEEQVRQQPEVYELLRAAGVVAKDTPQAMEFIWWLQDRYPRLDILASAPTDQIRELVTQFCEEKNYGNASSFSKDVLKWLQGEGERGILNRLVEIGRRAKQKSDTYRGTVSPFERYQTVPYHAVFFFLSADDFPAFIRKYWEDLNSLTGDYLDIYYSSEDIERKVSAFEAVAQFRSLEIEYTSFPAMLLWGQTTEDYCLIPFGRLSHDDVFDITKTIVQRIKENEGLSRICSEAYHLVEERLEALSPSPRIVIQKGKIIMGDTITMSGKFEGTVLNIKSTLTNVSQSIGQISGIDPSTQDQLIELVEQLNEELQQAPPEKAEDAEAVAESAKLLVETASKKQPNKAMVQVSAQGLKLAAKNIAEVLPVVLTIALQIVATVTKLVG